MLKSFVLIIAAALLPLFAVSPAQAAVSCYTVNGSGGYTEEICSGMRHEYLGSKVDEATSYNVRAVGLWNPSITLTAVVTDKLADGNCAWVRTRVTNTPYGNYQYDSARACGKGDRQAVSREIVQQIWDGGTVTFYLCQEGPVGCAAAFWSRSF